MKILVLSNLYPPDFIGGYELGCRQAVDALRHRGHEVLVLTSAPRTPVPSAPHVRRAFKLADVYDSYSRAHSDPACMELWEKEAHFLIAHNIHILTTTLEEFQPDVVYVWMIVGLGGLGLMACLHHMRVPWVWHLMDCVPRSLCSPGGHSIAALVRAYQRQIRGRYLACSQLLVDEIEECGISLHGQVEILPNWIAGPIPKPRTQYYKGGHLRIVTAGQISRSKGMDILIHAADQLRQAGFHDFSIDIFGKATDHYFPALINKLNVHEHVFLRGLCSQDKLLEFYRLWRYDVFAFPTWQREPFGFAPLEAAAHGCLPILSSVCGYAEWFVHGVHCLKAERTPEAFAQALAGILEGKIDLAQLARRASAVIVRDFHLDRLLPRIEQTLIEAARQPRSGAGAAREAYHLALLAEKLMQVLVQEPYCA